MAAGAEAWEIFRMILGEGLKLSLTGFILGLLGALWLGQAVSSLQSPVSSLLFGVNPGIHRPLLWCRYC
jgi:ABC-type antimicrobial peptide transport system permease subunit